MTKHSILDHLTDSLLFIAKEVDLRIENEPNKAVITNFPCSLGCEI